MVRPTANATPPMATATAAARTMLRRRPPDPLFFATTIGPAAGPTDEGTTGLVGTPLTPGTPEVSGAAGLNGSGVVGRFGSKLTWISF